MTAKKSLINFSKGFTLIELLVVVAIIAILVTLGASSYTTAQRKGRDVQRKSDLKQVQSALEFYYSDHNVYPDPGAGDTLTCESATAIAWGGRMACGSKTYLGAIPKDPLSSSQEYKYLAPTAASTCPGSGYPENCQKYVLFAKLENSGDSDIASGAANNVGNAECTLSGGITVPPGYNYCTYPAQ